MKSKNEKLAFDIYNFLTDKGLWEGCTVFFDGIAISSYGKLNGKHGSNLNKGLYEYADMNPLDYFEYANPETVSMMFEGSELYSVLNYFFEDEILAKWHDEFYNIFNKHGFYFELGNSWNLAACE